MKNVLDPRTLNVLVSRGRSALVILIGLSLVASAIDVVSASPQRTLLLMVGGARLACLFGCLALCRPGAREKVVLAGIVMGVSVLLCVSLVFGILRADYQPSLMIVCALSVAAGAFLPWGWRWQLFVVAVTTLFAAALYGFSAAPQPALQPLVLTAACLAVSVWFASDLELARSMIATSMANIDDSVAESHRLRAERQASVNTRTQALSEATQGLESYCRTLLGTLRPQISDLTQRLDTVGSAVERGPSADAKQLVARMSLAVERMDATLNELLDYLELGHRPCAREAIDLAEVARSHIVQLRERDPDRSVDVFVEEKIELLGDPVLLSEVMRRLLDNAWRFTSARDHASIRVETITLRGQPAGFRVQDNGRGIDPEHVERIFRPFERLDADDETTGLGMGLARVRRIVQRHGGHVGVVSTDGEGADFRVTVPPLSSGLETQQESD